MRSSRTIAACLALLGALAGEASLAGGDGAIKGRLVHKESGEPVIGAPIRLDGDRFAVSDEAGVFHFFGVEPGPHTISIDDPECAPFEARVVVPGDQVLQLDYALDFTEEAIGKVEQKM